MAILQWLQSNWGMVATVLFGISEALALIPGIQSNSVFQLIFNFLKSIVGQNQPPQA